MYTTICVYIMCIYSRSTLTSFVLKKGTNFNLIFIAEFGCFKIVITYTKHRVINVKKMIEI